MSIGLKIKSFIPFKQVQEEKGGGNLPFTNIPGIGSLPAPGAAQAKSPLPVTSPLPAPPQVNLAASAPVQNIIPMPPPPGAMTPTPPPTGEAAPPPEKKAGKDVMNLFIEEEAKVTQNSNLVSNLPDIDMAKLYNECLDCKEMLG